MLKAEKIIHFIQIKYFIYPEIIFLKPFNFTNHFWKVSILMQLKIIFPCHFYLNYLWCKISIIFIILFSGNMNNQDLFSEKDIFLIDNFMQKFLTFSY